MSWLKIADENATETLLADLLATLQRIQTEAVQGGINSFVWIEQEAREAINRAEVILGKKEGSVYDDPDYQRETLNVGDSGEFDEEHVLDRKPNYSVTPGPGSTTPGSPAPAAPDIPTGIV